jgi:hypothetical protein
MKPEEGFEPAIPWVRARCPPVGRLRRCGWGGAIRTLVSGFKDRGPASGRLPSEMERTPGVEPGFSGWKPDASAARPCPRDGATGENRTPAAGMGTQPSATDLRSHMVGAERFELSTNGLRGRCARPLRHAPEDLVPPAGVDLPLSA